MLKLRTTRFSGRCARHKRYNPAREGWGGIKGGCPRCQLLAEIWETERRLETLIHRFDGSPSTVEPDRATAKGDSRQLNLNWD